MDIAFDVVDQYLTANDTPGKRTVYFGFHTEEEALKKAEELRAFYYSRGEDFYRENEESKLWESCEDNEDQCHSIYIIKHYYRKLKDSEL